MKPEITVRQEQVLREALADLQASTPPHPARPPEILLVEVVQAQERELPEPRRTLGLIAAQAVVVLRGHMVPALAAFVGLTFLAAASASGEPGLLILTAALPVAAVLALAFLSGRRFDPAHDLIATTRTSVGAIVFARTALMLAVTVALGLVASLALATFGGSPFATLVIAWLGPTLVIAALATFLAQRWRLMPVTLLTLIAWAGVVTWVHLELLGWVDFGFATRAVLRPEPAALMVQLVMSGALLAAAWRLAGVSSGRRVVA